MYADPSGHFARPIMITAKEVGAFFVNTLNRQIGIGIDIPIFKKSFAFDTVFGGIEIGVSSGLSFEVGNKPVILKANLSDNWLSIFGYGIEIGINIGSWYYAFIRDGNSISFKYGTGNSTGSIGIAPGKIIASGAYTENNVTTFYNAYLNTRNLAGAVAISSATFLASSFISGAFSSGALNRYTSATLWGLFPSYI